MNGVYWASFLVMWAISAAAAWIMIYYRRKLLAALNDNAHIATRGGTDAGLAEWCRHMSLTVVTHTGVVFSTTFAELHASPASTFRNWNVPVQVTVWSDLDDEAIRQVPQPIEEEFIG